MKSSLRTSLNYVCYGGIAQSAMDTFATGTLITAYALLLGAGDMTIGFLAAIPYLSNLMHLFVAFLLEKGFSVKKISVVCSFFARPFLLLASLLVFYAGKSWTPIVLVIFLGGLYGIGNMVGGAWRPWMRALIPVPIMGRFFANRFKYMMIAKIFCFGFSYFLLKFFQFYYPAYEIYAYSILLLLAFGIGIYGAYTSVVIEDVPLKFYRKTPFLHKLMHCLKQKPFILFVWILGCLNLSVNFVLPFFTVFLLEKLKLQMSSILILTVLSQIAYIFVMKTLGIWSDKQGAKRILYITVPAFVISIIGFLILNVGYLNPLVMWMILICSYVLMGIGTAGFSLGVNNLSLLYVPKRLGSVYLSLTGAGISFLGAIGAISGGFCLSVFKQISNQAEHDITSWCMLFGVSIFLFVFSIVQLKKLEQIKSRKVS
ncbi:MAG: hypothetical protein IJO11_08040 [Alphaproteobacteria bacterium]|nr:hypothetical protein [Alphaproteobacteria bacterium]